MSVTSLLTTAATTSKNSSVAKIATHESNGVDDGKNSPLIKKLHNPSQLQQKLAKQLQKSRQTKAYSSKDLYTGKKNFSTEEQTPLVSIENSDEDEFDYISLKTEAETDDEVVLFKQPRSAATKYRFSTSDDCKEHLLRDGFRLDELSDDEDLDLIPPKADNATWWSCEGMTSSCSIQ
eukprot:TCONS_00047481-protein